MRLIGIREQVSTDGANVSARSKSVRQSIVSNNDHIPKVLFILEHRAPSQFHP